jgi:hypothetical protein
MLKLLLLQFDDRRPKVRKAAHSSLLSLLSRSASKGSPALSERLCPYLAQVVEATSADNTLPLLHVFPFLSQALPLLLPPGPLVAPLLSLTALKLPPVTSQVLSSLLSLLESGPDLPAPFTASLLATLLKTTSSHLPKADPACQSSYVRLISAALALLSSADPASAARISPAVFHLLVVYCSQGTETVAVATAELRKLASLSCVPASSLPAFRKLASFTASHATVLPFLAFLYCLHPSSPEAAPLLADLFSARSQADASGNKASKTAATDALSQVLTAAGPEAFLAAHPLRSAPGAPVDPAQLWVLDLLKAPAAAAAPST